MVVKFGENHDIALLHDPLYKTNFAISENETRNEMKSFFT